MLVLQLKNLSVFTERFFQLYSPLASYIACTVFDVNIIKFKIKFFNEIRSFLCVLLGFFICKLKDKLKEIM